MDVAIAPTKQRQKRSEGWERPEKNRSVNRVAWRRLDVFARMLKAGELEYCEHQASEKFARHYQGSLGVDVSMGESRNFDPFLSESGEYSRSYLAKKVADARAVLSPRQFAALVFLAVESDDLSDVGQQFCGMGNKPQARAAGLVLVQEALHAAALHFGFKTPPQRYHDRSPVPQR
jgi:hypothetical protein